MIMLTMQNLARHLVMCAIAIVSISSAQAGWVLATDPNTSDTATNPGYGSVQPGNQGPVTIAAWLKDLFDLTNNPNLISKEDTFGASAITGIDNGANYITLHYGNHLNFITNNLTLAYVCSSDCSTFSNIDVQGLSNYRIFGNDTSTNVPEPGSVALIGLGLLCMVRIVKNRKPA